MVKLKRFWKYMQWLEEQKMEAAIYSCSVGPLM
jgi:hypothetical protein